MATQRKITIAYHEANTKVAIALVESLHSTNVSFEHFICREGIQNPDYNQLLRGLKGEILLLVTDNYLKSESAMINALVTTQDLMEQNKLQLMVLDGLDANQKPVRTVYSRIGEIINYMNFWQEQYLALRQQGRKEGKISDELEIKTNKVRAISTNIGEYLRFLREQPAWTLEGLKAAAFKPMIERYQINGMVEEAAFARQMSAPSASSTIKHSPAPASTAPRSKAPVQKEPVRQAEPIVKASTPAPKIQEEKQAVLETVKKEVQPPPVRSNPIEKPKPTVEKVDLAVPANKTKTTVPEKQVERPIQKEIKRVDKFPSEEIDLDLSAIPGIGMLNRHVAGNNKPESKLSSDDMGDLEIKVPDFSIKKEAKKATEQPVEKIKKEVLSEEAKVKKIAVREEAKVLAVNTQEKKETSVPVKKKKFGIPNYLDDLKIEKSKEIEFPHHKLIQIQNCIEQGNYSAARKDLGVLTGNWPRKAILWKKLGEIAEFQSDYLQAGTHYSRALELDSKLPEVNYKLGLIIRNFHPDQMDKAISHFDKAIELNPNHVDAYYQLGVLLNEGKHRTKEAIPLFEKVLELKADHEFANYDLALIYFDKNDIVTARDYYKLAFKNNDELRTKENDLAFGMEKYTIKEVSKKKKKKNKKQLAKGAKKKEKKQPKKKFIDQTVLITGATSGIGKATAQYFADAGYRVILTGRREDRLFALHQKFSKENPNIRILQFDVRDIDSCADSLNELEGDFSEIDILINNAGLASGFDPIQEGALQDWNRMIDTNIRGLLHMVRLVSPQMVERGSGHIINVCSTAGHEVYPKGNVYCATKHAVNALTQSIRLDLYQHGIRVSQVSPAHVEETEFAKVRFNQDLEKAAIYDDFNPLRSPDVGRTIFWIANQPAHINVQDVILMGTQQANSNFIDRSGRKFD